MKQRLLAILAVASLAAANAKVVYVKPGGSGNGTSWTSGSGTVQSGLNAAAPGEEVWVAAGTYPERIVLKSGVGLYGGFSGNEDQRDERNPNPNANVSTLDGQAGGSVITAGPSVTQQVVMDGFTIQNGSGTVQAPTQQGPHTLGGGVYVLSANLRLSNNVIANNTAGDGGGVYFDNGTMEIANNSFTGNTSYFSNNESSDNQGSAIYGVSSAGTVVDSNRFSLNAGHGIVDTETGIVVRIQCPALSFTNNSLINNLGEGLVAIDGGTIDSNVFDSNGDGIDCSTSSTPYAVTNNVLINNGFYGIGTTGSATIVGNFMMDNGNNNGDGGLVMGPGNFTVERNTMVYNVEGGLTAIPSSAPMTLQASDNLIVHNTGTNQGGVYLSGSKASVQLSNNTIASNTVIGSGGCGIDIDHVDQCTLANNIIAFNNGPISNSAGVYTSVGTVSTNHNDVYNNSPANFSGITDPTGTNGNISQDPQFVNASAGNYTLQPTSPCIDTGDDSVVTAGDTDLEQAPRIVGPHVDIGAYESLSSLPFTFSEAVSAVRILGGLQAALPSDLQRLNVVGADTSANVIDIRDAARLIRKAAGLDANP